MKPLTTSLTVGLLLAAAATSPALPDERAETVAQLEAIEARYLAAGRLRTERSPADARFTYEDLARNFINIALRIEENADGSQKESEVVDQPLRRWETPIRYRLQGEEVTDEVEAEFAQFAAELSSLTGLSIERDNAAKNVDILIIGPEDRRKLAAQIKEQLPPNQWPPSLMRWLEGGSSPCRGDVSINEADEIVKANIFIKAEAPDLFRTMCIHEEMSQSLGLFNDFRAARPSIFNDDHEFALLTGHDQYLLRILYHERLRSGMTAEDIEPILQEVIEDIFTRW